MMQFSRLSVALRWLALVWVGLLPHQSSAAALIPLNAGMELTCQFVNNSSYPDNQVYILVLARDAANQVCYLNASGALVPVPGGQNTSMFSMTLNSFTGLQFPPVMTSGRLWISYGAPMNMATFAGGGIAQPNLANPGDPNINTIFDWMEFNVGGGQIYCNTSQVDLFGIPYTMELYDDAGGDYSLNSTRGISGCYADIKAQYLAYIASIPAAAPFSGLAGAIRIVAPGHGSFAAGQPNGNYFDAYIASVWAGPYRPVGVAQPSTQDVLGATGPLATQPQVDAAINRHVIDNPGGTNNPALYYQNSPANYYSAFWHQVNLAGAAYGFAYDDANDQSSLQVSTHPRGLVINLSGCAPTPTPSSTHSPLPSATRTVTRSATPTRSPTRTATLTHSPTPSATRTASSSATATATASPSATTSATSTGSPSATATATASASVTASATSTGSPSATATATASASVTASTTSTASPSVTQSGTPSPPPSATHAASATCTPSSSVTASRTPTATPSATPSATLSATRSASSTISASPGSSASPTPTGSPSPVPALSATASPTVPGFVQQERLLKLHGLYPNPFADTLKVYFTLRVNADVSLAIYNVAGEPIWRTRAWFPAGKQLLSWAGDNASHGRCASGVYVLRLEAAGADGTSDGFWEQAGVSR